MIDLGLLGSAVTVAWEASRPVTLGRRVRWGAVSAPTRARAGAVRPPSAGCRRPRAAAAPQPGETSPRPPDAAAPAPAIPVPRPPAHPAPDPSYSPHRWVPQAARVRRHLSRR